MVEKMEESKIDLVDEGIPALLEGFRTFKTVNSKTEEEVTKWDPTVEADPVVNPCLEAADPRRAPS